MPLATLPSISVERIHPLVSGFPEDRFHGNRTRDWAQDWAQIGDPSLMLGDGRGGRIHCIAPAKFYTHASLTPLLRKIRCIAPAKFYTHTLRHPSASTANACQKSPLADSRSPLLPNRPSSGLSGQGFPGGGFFSGVRAEGKRDEVGTG
jgi:hypothetical protein